MAGCSRSGGSWVPFDVVVSKYAYGYDFIIRLSLYGVESLVSAYMGMAVNAAAITLVNRVWLSQPTLPA